MTHLYYVPLEPVSGRYTIQWSRANTGWLERNWKRAGVQYTRLEGPNPTSESSLGIGKVLNPIRRAEWGFHQTVQICRAMANKSLEHDAVIWFDDFWHPGLEMIAQTRDASYGVDSGPRMFSFCHAQSVDCYDFMHKSRAWARPIEQGFMNIYDAVFVNNDYLKELLEVAFGDRTPVHNCGHVFSSEECREHVWDPELKREKKVVFSSRFDKEKLPHLFMDIVEETHKRDPTIQFVICSGNELKSDDLSAVVRAKELEHRGFLKICQNLTKTDYYRHLQSATVQLSTSLQDWVSFCLLEAVTFGCYPLYPNYRSFPEAFKTRSHNLYPFHPSMDSGEIVGQVAESIDNLMYDPDFLTKLVESVYFPIIVEPHNHTWKRQLKIMGVPFDDNTPIS